MSQTVLPQILIGNALSNCFFFDKRFGCALFSRELLKRLWFSTSMLNINNNGQSNDDVHNDGGSHDNDGCDFLEATAPTMTVAIAMMTVMSSTSAAAMAMATTIVMATATATVTPPDRPPHGAL